MDGIPHVVTRNASLALARALADGPGRWAIVASSAVLLYGLKYKEQYGDSKSGPFKLRQAEELDIVVGPGQRQAFLDKLKASPDFKVDAYTRHVSFLDPSGQRAPVDILTPPKLFKDAFDSETRLEHIDGVPVLGAAQLLRMAIVARPLRNTHQVRHDDTKDIAVLTRVLTARELDGAEKELLSALSLDARAREDIAELVGMAVIDMLASLGVQFV